MLSLCDRWQVEHASTAIFVAACFIAESVSMAHAREALIENTVPGSAAFRTFMAKP